MITAIAAEHAWEWVLAASAAVRAQSADDPLMVNDPRGECSPLRLPGSGDWHLDAPCEPAARALLNRYLPLCLPGTARLVVGQMGQSLDGRVASQPGVYQVINGRDGLAHLHRLRALVDAVLVGRGTVECDDPMLTVRHSRGPNPVRVVLDPGARLSSQKRVFREPEAATLHLVAQGIRPAMGAVHTDTVWLPMEPGQPFPPEAVLEALAERGLHRVLVEGGGQTVSQFLRTGTLTHLHVLVAPVILGRGVAGFSLPETGAGEQAPRYDCAVHPLGSDTLFAIRLDESRATVG